MIMPIHPTVQADKAKDAALSLLKRYGIKDPPVPVEQIIKKENWQLSYFHVSQDPDFADEEGFCRLIRGRYYLYLNAGLPTGRDIWTYAHETAHIILKHHEMYDVDELTEHEKWLLDREANIFAANYLMPEGWILDRIDNSQILIIADIYNLKTQFGVSWEAMINRLDELNVQSKNFTQSMFNRRRKLVQQDDLIIEADQNMKFLSCPGCGSRNTVGSVSRCRICGTYLFNDCTNPDCGRHNRPDAKLCASCGAETLLCHEGLLPIKSRRDRGGEARARGKAPELNSVQRVRPPKGGFGV